MSQPDYMEWKESSKDLLANNNIYGFAVTLTKLKMGAAKGDMNLYEQVVSEEVMSLLEANQYIAALMAIEEGLGVIQDKEKQMELLEKKAFALQNLGRYGEAEEAYQQILQAGVPQLTASGYLGLSAIHLDKYLETKALKELELAENFCQRAMELSGIDQVLQVRTARLFGKVYSVQRKYKKAVEVLDNANITCQQRNAAILNDLALAYLDLADAEQANKYAEVAETQAVLAKEPVEEARSLQIKGKIEDLLLEDFIRAKDYYLSAYYKYLEAGQVQQAFDLLQQIEDIDQTMNSENLKLLQRKVLFLSGKR